MAKKTEPVKRELLKMAGKVAKFTDGYIFDEWPPKCITITYQPKRPKSNRK
ncbi:MAG: cyclic lactone autoinducer peptide [Clostridiales bacterium]|nr:cyclic lactone autoinducer peptide [Clostridiales bacterium]